MEFQGCYLEYENELDRFLIVKKLGQGGFGRVYQGWDEKLQRDVSIKILPRTKEALKEAKILAQLDHPNIVPIYDVLEGEQLNYLIMKHVTGTAIYQHTLDLQQILSVGIQVCDGLTAAHKIGITHQDIKPPNLLWDPKEGQCMITDFGTAAIKAITNYKDIVGTPRFMAPEQHKGQEADARADIYSVGKVILALVQTNKIPAIPAKLRQVLQKATHKQKSLRFSDAEQLAHALMDVQQSLPTWTVMEQVVPEFGDGWNYLREVLPMIISLPTGLLRALVASAATWIMMQSSLLGQEFYQAEFQQIYGPLLAGGIAILSLPLASLLVFLLAFPPIFVNWASMGILYGIFLLSCTPLILCYPGIFIAIVFFVLWDVPLLLLLLSLMAGYYYGMKGGLLAGILLPLISFTLSKIPLTASYQEVVNTPIYVGSNWFIHGMQAIVWDHTLELLLLLVNWFRSDLFQIALVAMSLGFCAGWFGQRKRMGMVLLVLTCSAVTALLHPLMLQPLVFAFLIFFSWIWLWSRLQTGGLETVTDTHLIQKNC